MRIIILSLTFLASSITARHPDPLYTTTKDPNHDTLSAFTERISGGDTNSNVISIKQTSRPPSKNIDDFTAILKPNIRRLHRRGNTPKKPQTKSSPTPSTEVGKSLSPLDSSTKSSGLFTPLTNSYRALRKVAQSGAKSSGSEKKSGSGEASNLIAPLAAGVKKFTKYKPKSKEPSTTGESGEITPSKAAVKPKLRPFGPRSRSMSSGTLNGSLRSGKSSSKGRTRARRQQRSSKSRNAFDLDRQLMETLTIESPSRTPPTSSSEMRKGPTALMTPDSGLSDSRKEVESKASSSHNVRNISGNPRSTPSPKQTKASAQSIDDHIKSPNFIPTARFHSWLDQTIQYSHQNVNMEKYANPETSNRRESKSPGISTQIPLSPISSAPQKSTHSEGTSPLNSETMRSPFSHGPTAEDVVPKPPGLSKVRTRGDRTGGIYEKLEQATWGGKEFEGPLFSPDWDGPTPKPSKRNRRSKPPGLPKVPEKMND